MRVILESPYSGDVERNEGYALRALADSLSRGEAPFASHLLYTRVLDDLAPEERRKGMVAGFAWIQAADKTVVYADHGISEGMRTGIEIAVGLGKPVEYRYLAKGSE